MQEGNVELISTPSKKRAISKEHDFTSPLKKIIASNLDEYKSQKRGKLSLARDFVPTPLPEKDQKWQSNADRGSSTFFDTCEGFFEQSRQRKSAKKTTSSMAMAPEVTRDEFATISNYFHERLHFSARTRLKDIQTQMYPQYWFELTQGFSLLFYGVGSKRNFLEDFALGYLSKKLALQQYKARQVDKKRPKTLDTIPCVVINGYNPTCNYRDVYKRISSVLIAEGLDRNETKFWGNHVLLNIAKLKEHYRSELPDIKIIVVVHNIDGPTVRRSAFQDMLSSLAMIRQIAVVASADHVYAPLLWDNLRAQNYNFIYHEVTTYEPSAVESSFRDVLKLGHASTVTGTEGARYVLESLTQNSKRMYKLLLQSQLQNMAIHSKDQNRMGTSAYGLEFKDLLAACSAQFIVSNEISLRTMLTEYTEHKMAVISRNTTGTEMVYVPYTFADIDKMLGSLLKSV